MFKSIAGDETSTIVDTNEVIKGASEELGSANIAGADTRCLSSGTSSLSAFIRVARHDDIPDNFYLHLNVDNLPNGTEPIDILQNHFNEWSQLLPNILSGDANNDQLINISDILILIGLITGSQIMSENQLYAVDMNSDSTINIQDIIIIVNIILN